MNLNKAMIIGNLTRDPEVRTTPAGQTVASFAVATNMVWTDSSGQKQEKVEFHNIVAWRKLADICGAYLKKGRQVYIEGRLQTRDWVGQDGVKRYRTEIIAENMIMLGSAGAAFHAPAPAAPARPVSNIEEIPTIDSEVPSNVMSSSGENFSRSNEADNEEEVRVDSIPF
ncbi:single-stranded DNA-binding protein [Candidatus Falkowbacteria bacterium CG10_big_fil_rev_8_21_14_0_10_43_10]|uniref:Single-stranded DNA-binding protein n=1 Tax=Candidatus Falkowbacteria bacterium CG10_big_fil_rev_8_21_14_0_10_43_10 TaxID=1974567 RepID=A0A2H0V2H3_9BACT|nr:MAG: single-stranded DNA-binding protein [Candidatus Falkowbacteria bacterium CG10_big_fil_rev_8_21_14_0_10_43_10]